MAHRVHPPQLGSWLHTVSLIVRPCWSAQRVDLPPACRPASPDATESVQGVRHPRTVVGVTSADNHRPRDASRVWAITALGLVVVLACLALGAWQLDRARTRDTPTTGGDPMAVPALPLADALPVDGRVSAGARPVAVTVTGRYDQDHQFTVPGREQGGTPATYVVTPLVPAQGKAVLVARGWLPYYPAQGQPGAPPAPLGDVTVTGWLVPSEPLEAATVDPLALPDGQVATVTAARLAGLVPYPIVDGYVGLVEEIVPEPTGPVGLVHYPTPNPLGGATGRGHRALVDAEPLLRLRVVVLRPRGGLDVGPGGQHRAPAGGGRRTGSSGSAHR